MTGTCEILVTCHAIVHRLADTLIVDLQPLGRLIHLETVNMVLYPAETLFHEVHEEYPIPDCQPRQGLEAADLVGGLSFVSFETVCSWVTDPIGGATQITIAGTEGHHHLALELHREIVRIREITS
jgi:hypothetical protein